MSGRTPVALNIGVRLNRVMQGAGRKLTGRGSRRCREEQLAPGESNARRSDRTASSL